MLGLDIDRPCILIMGGTQGLGPIKEMSKLLDRSYLELQVIIATGTNKRLFRWLKARRFRKKFVILSNADNVNELMEMATIIITKAGGITTAEALAKGLPMLIVNSLPGQEMMNTRFLLSEGVAVRAESPDEVETILSELIYNKNKLKAMSEKAHSLARPDSSAKIASSVLELVNNYNTYR
jgi:processive 1,2-diacylglycerol beta-glucosyltransferase